MPVVPGNLQPGDAHFQGLNLKEPLFTETSEFSEKTRK